MARTSICRVRRRSRRGNIEGKGKGRPGQGDGRFIEYMRAVVGIYGMRLANSILVAWLRFVGSEYIKHFTKVNNFTCGREVNAATYYIRPTSYQFDSRPLLSVKSRRIASTGICCILRSLRWRTAHVGVRPLISLIALLRWLYWERRICRGLRQWCD